MMKAGSISQRIETILQAVSNCLMIAITLLIFVEVVGRYLGQSHGFMEEFAKWGQIWFAYLLLGVLEKWRSNFTMDILPRHLPQKYNQVLLIIFDIVTLTFAVFLLWSGVQLCYHLIQMQTISGTEIRVPTWITRLAVPLGAVFLAFFSIEHLVTNITSLRKSWNKKS
jgi:C4-dicarboxylate transporter DctQ subunit